jgi:cytochrome P450
MRLSPSVVAILWREVAEDGFSIDGEVIPAGCDLGASMYCLHHDSSIFKDPFEFQPERWLATGIIVDDERISIQRRAINPFGLGTRKCIAWKMAMAEIGLCLAHMLWALDMRQPMGSLRGVGAGKIGLGKGREREGEFQLYEHITCRHDGPYLQWARRK